MKKINKARNGIAITSLLHRDAYNLQNLLLYVAFINSQTSPTNLTEYNILVIYADISRKIVNQTKSQLPPLHCKPCHMPTHVQWQGRSCLQDLVR